MYVALLFVKGFIKSKLLTWYSPKAEAASKSGTGMRLINLLLYLNILHIRNLK